MKHGPLNFRWSLSPPCTFVTAAVGLPAGSADVSPHGPIFCGSPFCPSSIHHDGVISLKCAFPRGASAALATEPNPSD